MTKRLRLYQKQALIFAKTKGNSGLFLKPGLGKTAISLTHIRLALQDDASRQFLIVAPLRVCRLVWRQEAQEWPEFHHLTFALVCGSAKERKAALEQQANIYLLNYDNLSWFFSNYPEREFYCLICDESSKLKSHSTLRFKALRKRLDNFQQHIILTGTPNAQSYIDLWAQIYLLDRGQRLGKTITAYRSKYFTSDYMGYSWVLKPGAAEQILAAIEDITMALRAEDYVMLPQLIESDYKIELTNEQQKAYRKFEREQVLELLEEETIAATSKAALINKLQQFASGFVYDNGTTHHLHQLKLDALDDLLEQLDEKPKLIFYRYQAESEAILDKYPQASTDLSEENIANWNEGKVPLLLCHPASMAHGINLQAGSNQIIWYGLTYSLEEYKQAIARLHRSGQQKTVYVYRLVVTGSVDERILQILQGKEANLNQLFEALSHDYRRQAA